METNESVRDIMVGIATMAKERGKVSDTLYALKALVELGRGWHQFRQIRDKMVEITGDQKMRKNSQFAIQDTVKKRLAFIDTSNGARLGNFQVRLKDECFDEILSCIDEHIHSVSKHLQSRMAD